MQAAFKDPYGNDIVYLNRPGDLFLSPVLKFLQASKQGRGAAKQWLGMIKSAPGVKQAELDDIKIEALLGQLEDEVGGKAVTREALISAIEMALPTVKEVTLGQANYSGYSFGAKHGGIYKEMLFILNSEKANVQDQMDLLRWELDDLNFNLDKLADDPGIVDRIERQMALLKAKTAKAIDFTAHHYSSLVHNQNLGRNLFAHMRLSRFPDRGLLFVDEIQSDWAQRGRNNDFTGNYPPAPFVTKTELWAGLLLRRAMQLAAKEGFARIAWINGSAMCNGGMGGGNFDDFYRKILPPIADKVLGKSGVKTALMKVQFGNREYEVPGVEITDKAREVLSGALPLYSLADLIPTPRTEDDPHVIEILRDAREMLGSVATVRAVNRLYDVATGQRVAGSYVNRLVQAALDAREFDKAVWHESFHAAYDLLATDEERDMLTQAFWPTSSLNQRVRDALLELGMPAAANQCSDPKEAAAHAFALYRSGVSVFDPRKEAESAVERFFRATVDRVTNLAAWIARLGRASDVYRANDFCQRLANGELRMRRDLHDAVGQLAYPAALDAALSPASHRSVLRMR